MSEATTAMRTDLRRVCDALDPIIFRCAHDLRAPAKLNLRLKVLGRRGDGYHLLSMCNVSSTLHDDVSVILTREPECSVELKSREHVNIAASENSITRAFREFWREFGSDDPPVGFSATLTKRIPIGAGLGGGSSDAGAMLRFLAQHTSRRISETLNLSAIEFERRVMQAAIRVGADVPYAYRGGVCWVTGIGDVVQRFEITRAWPGEVLITVPPEPVATAAFYQFFREQHPLIVQSSDHHMENLAQTACMHITPELLQNDFERDVCIFQPVVETALRCAREFFPASTSLTGSGSAIFSLVRSEDSDRIQDYYEAAAREGMSVHRVQLVGG